MKAAQLDRYAKAGRLVVREVPVPEPAANEVLVKVRAAAVNPLELLLVAGSVRLIQDYRLPQTLGNECSGVVERVGSKVGKFRPGDAVYTRLPLERIGAFAEYVVVEEAALAKMPAGYAFDVAAAVPLTGLTAWQGLVEVLEAHPGQTLLIPGGSGSFGQNVWRCCAATEPVPFWSVSTETGPMRTRWRSCGIRPPGPDSGSWLPWLPWPNIRSSVSTARGVPMRRTKRFCGTLPCVFAERSTTRTTASRKSRATDLIARLRGPV